MKVSVVIPTYNRSFLVKECINSVLNQTFKDFEILVCDDGSTDDTRQVVESFNDERIKYIYMKNSGRPAVPRNVGIEHAKGDLIAFLDSDDSWMPGKLEHQVEIFSKNQEIDLVYSYARAFDEEGERERIIKYRYKRSGDLRKWLLFYNFIPTLTVVVKKIFLIDSHLKFNEDMDFKAVEDYDLWLRVALSGGRFKFLDLETARYRLHGEQISFDKVLEIERLERVLSQSFLRDKVSSFWIKKARAKLQLRMFKIYLRESRSEKCEQALLNALEIDFLNVTALTLLGFLKIGMFRVVRKLLV